MSLYFMHEGEQNGPSIYTHQANNVIALNGLRNELNKPCSFAFVRFAHKIIKKEPLGTTKFYKQKGINIEKNTHL